jgi:hypothetical protein
MEQSDESEAYAESVDLERFVRLVSGLPTVSKPEIERLLADEHGKRAFKAIPSPHK